MHLRRLFPALLALSFSSGLQASPADCANIAEDQSRLICYDSFYREPTPHGGATDAAQKLDAALEGPISLLERELAEEAALTDFL